LHTTKRDRFDLAGLFSLRPWNLLDSGPVPGENGELRLYQRGDEYVIKVNTAALMSSRMHGSEDALAELGCSVAADRESATVLVGGLGMGFTLAATLKQLGPVAQVVVAELAPVIIAWNQTLLADLAGRPLDDPRVTVFEGDIANRLKADRQTYDAILLDVDNGPEGLTHKDNNWLYSAAGLEMARSALKRGGMLAVWSEGPSPLFSQRLRQAGFDVTEERPRAHGKGRGGRHTIWLARKTD